MKAGKSVWYVRGGPVAATVIEVVGTGPSGYKVLDLDVGGKKQKAVPHQLDRGRGHCWLEYGSAHAAPEKKHATSVPPPAVPVSHDAGRATAGGGNAKDRNT